MTTSAPLTCEHAARGVRRPGAGAGVARRGPRPGGSQHHRHCGTRPRLGGGATTARSIGAAEPPRRKEAVTGPPILEVVLARLAAGASDARTQAEDCDALGELAGSGPGKRDRVTTAGGLEAVLGAMGRARAGAEDVQLAGARALYRLSRGSARGTLGLISLRGLQVTIEAMARHSEKEPLQEAGCRVLQNAAACSAECRAKVTAAGGAAAVLAALRAHPHATAVQEAGCQALRDLAAYNSAAQEEIFAHGGIQVVLRGMEAHRASSAVQVSACGVLRNLAASSAERQEGVVSRGGVRVVLDSMAAHPEAPQVQWAGCWALYCTSVRNAEVAADVAAHGAVAAALDAMARHRGEPKVQEAGCWVLKELAAHLHLGSRPATVFVASAQALLKTLEQHATIENVKTAASAALKTLAVYDKGGLVRATCLGRCGRLGSSATKHALATIQE